MARSHVHPDALRHPPADGFFESARCLPNADVAELYALGAGPSPRRLPDRLDVPNEYRGAVGFRDAVCRPIALELTWYWFGAGALLAAARWYTPMRTLVHTPAMAAGHHALGVGSKGQAATTATEELERHV